MQLYTSAIDVKFAMTACALAYPALVYECTMNWDLCACEFGQTTKFERSFFRKFTSVTEQIQDQIPMVTLATALENIGISAFRFDFGGNG